MWQRYRVKSQTPGARSFMVRDGDNVYMLPIRFGGVVEPAFREARLDRALARLCEQGVLEELPPVFEGEP